jgi:hypothetical protein
MTHANRELAGGAPSRVDAVMILLVVTHERIQHLIAIDSDR